MKAFNQLWQPPIAEHTLDLRVSRLIIRKYSAMVRLLAVTIFLFDVCGTFYDNSSCSLGYAVDWICIRRSVSASLVNCLFPYITFKKRLSFV